MLSAEEKKEKEQFFLDLDRLGDLDEDEQEEMILGDSEPPPMRCLTKPAASIPRAILAPSEEVIDERTPLSRKRKQPVEAAQSDQRAARQPRLARSSTLPEQKPDQKGPLIPRLERAATVPERGPIKGGHSKSRTNFTDLSNVQARLKGEGQPKLKKLPKFAAKPKPIDPDKQIFKGLVFFFVPNNDDDSGARIRIHQAIQYGAQWTHEFCEEVTHIIVTNNDYDVSVVAKSFPSNQIPKHPALLRINWVLESCKSRYLQETHWERFQLPGWKTLHHPDEVAPQIVATAENRGVRIGGPPQTNAAGQDLKRGDSSRNEPDHPNQKSDDEAALDILEIAIRDVRGGADVASAFDLSEESESGDEDADRHVGVPTGSDANTATNASNENAGFLCMGSHNDTAENHNANAQTIEKLQEMAIMYESRGDQWRTKAFREAIGKLRRHNQLIRTSQEARKIGLGESIAGQVEEIVLTGRYKRLEYAQDDPRTQVLKLFKGVYGAGEATAYSWIAQGFRTLQDLQTSADLTPTQRIGLEHYNDFQQRIPRKEVEQHAAVVESALTSADPKLQLIIGGSYRRGSKDSGDIDCIITMEGADIVRIRTLMLDTVIPALTDQGFLKVALATGRSSGDDTSKWHGASALPDCDMWRRIDFLFVPWEELGAALIYFTGNDLFNRSIRFLARKKGMRLNQHGLCKHVMRGPGRQRINDGTLVESHDERKIFQILGVPYRPPEERNL
ncbi:hypothetical protein G647_06408 [Cladophialophora carrionii CBS 160.54]|uniref:DNA polymerase lambda n=1 Tax=Cladophialophora carrionii CBS 160.54 TaxID=1279043 RepID=V9D610_9EURO|nr:uncharacterized protein G647_06408 [Cladophialophora carrionii CBS 160.54]ETI22334.1 hypothetical protein G647_06408 [Cladophialophora carrionii CBS 160.54]